MQLSSLNKKQLGMQLCMFTCTCNLDTDLKANMIDCVHLCTCFVNPWASWVQGCLLRSESTCLSFSWQNKSPNAPFDMFMCTISYMYIYDYRLYMYMSGQIEEIDVEPAAWKSCLDIFRLINLFPTNFGKVLHQTFGKGQLETSDGITGKSNMILLVSPHCEYVLVVVYSYSSKMSHGCYEWLSMALYGSIPTWRTGKTMAFLPFPFPFGSTDAIWSPGLSVKPPFLGHLSPRF